MCGGGGGGVRNLDSCIVQIIGHDHLQSRIVNQLSCLLEIRPLQAHHHGLLHAHFLDRLDDAQGNRVATHDTTENIDCGEKEEEEEEEIN